MVNSWFGVDYARPQSPLVKMTGPLMPLEYYDNVGNIVQSSNIGFIIMCAIGYINPTSVYLRLDVWIE